MSFPQFERFHQTRRREQIQRFTQPGWCQRCRLASCQPLSLARCPHHRDNASTNGLGQLGPSGRDHGQVWVFGHKPGSAFGSRAGRGPTFTVVSWRKSCVLTDDATSSSSGSLAVSWHRLSLVDARTEKVEAAGIAPASQNSQIVSQHSDCVDTRPSCLHTACSDLALRELVAGWHMLTLAVRQRIINVARGAS